MKYSKSFTLITAISLFLSSSNLLAQINTVTVALKFDKKSLHITSFPFNEIIVLDNRIDTSKIFTYQNGKYPPTTLTLAQPTSITIKNYIQNATSNLLKENKTLLINIDQLRVSNKREKKRL